MAAPGQQANFQLATPVTEQLVFELAAPEPPSFANFLPGGNAEALAAVKALAAGDAAGATLQETMLNWRRHLRRKARVRVLPLPHPSWRNNAWLTKNPWFEAELLPVLRREVRKLL